MLSAPGCPGCRQAKQYFATRREVAHHLDLEKNPRAVKKYMMLQKKFGFKAGTIPVLVVNGTLIISLNIPQIEAAPEAGPLRLTLDVVLSWTLKKTLFSIC
jgi:glutaredoxin